jgi:AraC-like DNA-binding protein
MHSAPHEPWTVARLARTAHLSRSAFALMFTRTTGQAPLEYLRHWRMNLAQALLEARVPLPEVAARSGYASEVAFHRAFKRTTGRTPGAVRRAAPRAPR